MQGIFSVSNSCGRPLDKITRLSMSKSCILFWRVLVSSSCHGYTKDIHNKCKGVASLKSPDATCLPNMVQLASRLMSSSVDLMVYGPSIQELLQIALQELSAHDEAVDSLVPLNLQYVADIFR